jgi:DNA adenine methylase
MLFRYPGGKSKLVKTILWHLPSGKELREPFFGGGAITFAATHFESFWINDLDRGIAAIWTEVIQNPSRFKRAIKAFKPSVAKFYKWQDDLRQGDATPLKKLAVHQMSFSGLGTMAGSPIGGRNQTGSYKIDCRWSASSLCKKVDACHEYLAGRVRYNRCTSLDFEQMLGHKDGTVIYLDPPYFEKGGQLYQNSFSDSDHARLAKAMKSCQNKWLLSYDNHTAIKKFYGWAHIKPLALKYTINGAHQDSELLIGRHLQSIEFRECG